MTTTELITVDQNAISQIDEIVGECGLIQSAQEKGVMAAFRMAKGINALRSMITPHMMKDIMELQGSSLGFRTDKDKDGGYAEPVVKECLIESLLRGARPIGNEWNIIASRSYLTKEYFVRALAELPGLTDLVIEFGVPAAAGEKGSLVPVEASWLYEGKRDHLKCDVLRDASGKIIADNRIPVRVNSGQGTDAILGKAERKVRARILSRITNTTWSDGDVGDVIDTTGVVLPNGNEGLKGKMAANAKAATSRPETPEEAPESQAYHEPSPAARSNGEGHGDAKVSTEAPPFEPTATQSSPQQPTLNDLEPRTGETVAKYHQRLKAFIDAAKTAEELIPLMDMADQQLKSNFLTGFRHKDIIAAAEKRGTQLQG